jgi:RNA-splicing ligase RtcB
MIELTGRYTSAKIFADTIEENVYSQVYDIINSKAFEGQTVVCMPDVHSGKSGPCGLVATIGNYVCPEHIGVDIGCTVSMLILDKHIPVEKYADFEHKIKVNIPFGTKINDRNVIDEKEFYKFLTTGFNRYRNCWPEMLSDLPSKVDEKWVSEQLKRLNMNEMVFYRSLGSVGGGNHFIEYDEQVDGDLAGVTLHFGSRNFGVKVCAYWMSKAKKQTEPGQIVGYLTGEELRGYLADMCFAQLYAQYNHMTVQNIIKKFLNIYGIKVDRVITSTHNFVDLEDHTLRKSAIRSYKGEEMLVPFNMRDGIAICEGLSNAEWLNACAHGAGRKLSRSAAKANLSLDEFVDTMKDVYSTTVCAETIDESPMAYKDTDEIVNLIKETCTIKFMMVPKINIKSTKGE